MTDPNIVFAEEVKKAIQNLTGTESMTHAQFTQALESWSIAETLIKHLRSVAQRLTKMASEMERFKDDHRSKITHAVIPADSKSFTPSVKHAKTPLNIEISPPKPLRPKISFVSREEVSDEKKASSPKPFQLVGAKGRPIDPMNLTFNQRKKLPMAIKRAVHFSYHYNLASSTDDKSFTVEAKPSSILRPYNTFVITPYVKKASVDQGYITAEELASFQIPDMEIRKPDEDLVEYVLRYFDVQYDREQDYMYPSFLSTVYSSTNKEATSRIMSGIVSANRNYTY